MYGVIWVLIVNVWQKSYVLKVEKYVFYESVFDALGGYADAMIIDLISVQSMGVGWLVERFFSGTQDRLFHTSAS